MQIQNIPSKIHEILGVKVMLDFDLAELYEVENRMLKQSVRRNQDRFPNDFMFQLTHSEWQEVITNCDNLPAGVKFSPAPPFAFTEQGVAMLSGILRSKKAVQVNIAIMRTFVLIRQYALTHMEISEKLRELETRFNKQFSDVYEAINYLLLNDKQVVEQKQRRKIGYKSD